MIIKCFKIWVTQETNMTRILKERIAELTYNEDLKPKLKTLGDLRNQDSWSRIVTGINGEILNDIYSPYIHLLGF